MSAQPAGRDWPQTLRRIDDITVGERARKDYGDLTSLVESIREHNLLQPVGVLADGHLLFGGRRLEACRQLDWDAIPVVLLDTRDDALSLLKAERDENTCRKDMTLSELVGIGRRIEELERPAARERMLAGVATPSDQSIGGSVSDRSANETRRRVGDALGISGATYERAKRVVEAADDESVTAEVRQVAQQAVREMDETGKAWAPSEKVRDARTPEPVPHPRPKPTAGRPSTRHVLRVAALNTIVTKVSGYHEAITKESVVDPALTREEAIRLTDDLSKSIAALQRLNRLIKERTK